MSRNEPPGRDTTGANKVSVPPDDISIANHNPGSFRLMHDLNCIPSPFIQDLARLPLSLSPLKRGPNPNGLANTLGTPGRGVRCLLFAFRCF